MFIIKHRNAGDKQWARRHYQEYLGSFHWRITRWLYSIIPLLGRRCRVCTSRGIWEMHHANYSRVGEEWPGDLVRLCPVCHKRVHWAVDRGTALHDAHKRVRKSKWGKKRRKKIRGW